MIGLLVHPSIGDIPIHLDIPNFCLRSSCYRLVVKNVPTFIIPGLNFYIILTQKKPLLGCWIDFIRFPPLNLFICYIYFSSSMELNVEEFLLVSVVDAIVSQVMMLSKEKNLQLVHEIPDGIKAKHLLGDQVRLQLVLSDFLLNIARYAPSPDGWVEIKVSPGLEVRQDGNELVHLQIRYHCR